MRTDRMTLTDYEIQNSLARLQHFQEYLDNCHEYILESRLPRITQKSSYMFCQHGGCITPNLSYT
jgi:hypothetical protein